MTMPFKATIAIGVAIALGYAGMNFFIPSIIANRYAFEFQGVNGRVKSTDLLDSNLVMFFGYASCPDVCPTTIYDIKRAVESLEKDDQDRFHETTKIIFVSIDPERDTPEHVQQYIDFFFKDSGIGAVASREDTDKIIDSFGVYYAKDPLKEGTNPSNYTISHTAGVFVFAKGNQLVKKVSPATVQNLHEAFKTLLKAY